MTTAVPASSSLSASRPRTLRARDVADLTVASAYPCISVLMPTEPSARMTAADLERLHGLLGDVDDELRNRGVTTRGRLMRKLANAAQQAAGHPTDRGLAMYVNLAVQRTFSLPMPVRARSVVERTFATRVLLTALHRMPPPHVLLVLHAASASLYQGADGGLRLVGHQDAFRSGGPVRVPALGDAGAAEASDDLTDSFLRGVDHMLGGYRAEHPSPLVLGGSPTVIDKFCAISRNLTRFAGRVAPGDGETAPALAQASSVVVERYLRSRRDDALVRLHDALAAHPMMSPAA